MGTVALAGCSPAVLHLPHVRLVAVAEWGPLLPRQPRGGLRAESWPRQLHLPHCGGGSSSSVHAAPAATTLGGLMAVCWLLLLHLPHCGGGSSNSVRAAPAATTLGGADGSVLAAPVAPAPFRGWYIGSFTSVRAAGWRTPASRPFTHVLPPVRVVRGERCSCWGVAMPANP